MRGRAGEIGERVAGEIRCGKGGRAKRRGVTQGKRNPKTTRPGANPGRGKETESERDHFDEVGLIAAAMWARTPAGSAASSIVN